MTDYISRQAAIEAVEKCQQYKVSKEDYAVDFAEVKTALMLLPTADVRENEKGEWEEIAESGLSDLRRCSNCGHIEAVGLEIMTPKPNYCPFCGADMRGEANV